MSKNPKSIACPSCKSIDIDLTVGYQNALEQETIYEDVPAFEYSKEKVMECHCKNCDNRYSVSQGKDTYTLLRKPLSLTCCGDVKLLSIYTSEYDYDFKLIKMSPFSGRSVLMAYVENDEYPVIIQQEKGIEKDLPKVKSLIFNTWMNRYR